MATSAKDVEQTQNANGADTDDDEKDKDERAALQDLAPGTRVSVMVTMPVELKIRLLDEAAKSGENMTLARFVRETLADTFDVELPNVIRQRAKKYATEEERIAAQKAASKKRNDLIKSLLKAYNEGNIDLESLMDDEDDDDE